jgi:hypothetical protein
MHRGFIPLHRKTKDNWIYSDCNKLGAWCKILMEVNHKPKKTEIEGELIYCNRGQSINSLDTWRKVFGKGWTIAKVRTFFKTLKNDSMINLEGLRKTTRLTVCNYESYNSEQQRDNKETTHRQHTDNNEITTNNNVNNANNVNNVNKPPKFVPDISALDIEKIELLNEWINYKKGKKQGYKAQTGITKLINQFNKESYNDIKEAIDKAIQNNYAGVFINKSNSQVKKGYQGAKYTPTNYDEEAF